MRYTFSDDEEDSDNVSTRISTRDSGISTPAEHAGPTVTASGRQVKSRLGGMYGETMLMDQRKELEHERAAANANSSEPDQDESSGRLHSSTRPRRPTRAPRRIDDSSEEMKGESGGDEASTGNEWSGNEEEPDAEEFEANGDDEDDEMSANDSDMNDAPPPDQDSLVVQLRYKKGGDHDQSRLRDRPNDENGDSAAADCIAVDSGQRPLELGKAENDRVHLDDEASKEEALRHDANVPIPALPRNGVHGHQPVLKV